MTQKNRDLVFISNDDVVTVTNMNHITEIQHMEKSNSSMSIKKLDKERYLVISTGEIKYFDISENRRENYNSLRQTFKRLRYLINNNFIGEDNELHVTLTYKENMVDPKRLYTDFDKFIKKMRYMFKDTSSIDYLSVVEPQGRGAWHCHVLMRFNDLNNAYVANDELRALWGRGFVRVNSLKDVDNIGAYLSAYLTDVELTGETFVQALSEENEIIEKEIGGETKKIVKGGRLHMYPSGMNLYRKSKGIEMPKREKMKYKDIKKVVGSAQPHYQKVFHIENDDFENKISFLEYNKKRL